MNAIASAAGRRRTAPAVGLDRGAFIRPIAHRGLHDRRQGRIENTAPAFLAAIGKGYGIECDLQAAEDGTPMVFHDETLERLIGMAGRIAAWSPASLARLRYKRQDERILKFAEFLELVDGRVPLLVEVKRNRRPSPAGFLQKIARHASAYRGPVALMSFNREFVTALAELAPTVPRGQVAGTHQLPPGWWVTPNREIKIAAVGRLLGRAPANIGFYAVDVKMLRAAAAWRERTSIELPLFSWTIRTARERVLAARWADAPIFEGYEA
jgi:glycerophosphoryl diester phosphodiesterase